MNGTKNKVIFNNVSLDVVFGRYLNERIAIMLVDNSDVVPEVYAYATVNIPEVELNSNEVIIKDYSENKGILDALITAGIISSPQKHVKKGFVECPICLLLIEPSFK